jgi:PhnB protein
MAQLIAYLQFAGKAQEAMKFYQQALGGELTMQTIGESPMAADMPAEAHNNVLHSALKGDGFVLMGADMMETGDAASGSNVSLCLVCSSQQEIESLFSKLSQGGDVTHPLKEEFFGYFGDLTDKYGFNWMFQFDKNAPGAV